MLPSLGTLVALSAFSTATLSAPNYSCKTYIATTPISTHNVHLAITPPANQSEMTAFITSYTSQTSNFLRTDTNGSLAEPTEINNSGYQIYTQLCTPSTFENGTDLEFAVHGVGFDHTYWNFGGNGSENNYVESAIAAGRSVLIYDTLGVGLSSTPDGITVVQRSVDIEIAAALVQGLKTSWDGHQFGKIVGVGHGYGGSQILGVAEKYAGLLDGMVLMSSAPDVPALLTSFAASSLGIASLNNSTRFGSLNSSYLVSGDIYDAQRSLFHFPYFDPAILQAYEDTKATVTLGVLLTLQPAPAFNFTKPVLVVAGDRDYRACGGNCHQNVTTNYGSQNILDSYRQFIPSASNFTTHITANTGHAMNLHYSSQETFHIVERWISNTV
ncbi:alpha/beta-hydrolase [Phlegmacium glaucopus]|nr:alpha/beta-hydrolase [Phlegmacium glaucopus]